MSTNTSVPNDNNDQKALRGLASRAWGLENYNSTKKPVWKGHVAEDKKYFEKKLKAKPKAISNQLLQGSHQAQQQHRLLLPPPGLRLPPLPPGLPVVPGYTWTWTLDPPVTSPSNSSRSSGSETEVKDAKKDGKVQVLSE